MELLTSIASLFFFDIIGIGCFSCNLRLLISGYEEEFALLDDSVQGLQSLIRNCEQRDEEEETKVHRWVI